MKEFYNYFSLIIVKHFKSFFSTILYFLWSAEKLVGYVIEVLVPIENRFYNNKNINDQLKFNNKIIKPHKLIILRSE